MLRNASERIPTNLLKMVTLGKESGNDWLLLVLDLLLFHSGLLTKTEANR